MSVWEQFKDPSYELTDLGRPAVFLIPSEKLRRRKIGEDTVEAYLHDQLGKHYHAFTYSTVPTAGMWWNGECLEYNECRRYVVSFLGKERVPDLLRLLAEIARVLEEECLYVEAGQYACLLAPKQQKNTP